MNDTISRRELLRSAASIATALALPAVAGCGRPAPAGENRAALLPGSTVPNHDVARLKEWTATLRNEGLAAKTVAAGKSATRAGELAIGTPYEPFTLEAYLKAGGNPLAREPLVLSLTRFDCVTLLESSLAVARVADDPGTASWERFGREVERMRYRNGVRSGYSSRLHYFSEWIADGEKRGLVRNIARELGGIEDRRPLRFMTEHRGSYLALKDDTVFAEIGRMERGLDDEPRVMIPTDRIAAVADRIATGDVLGFATAISGLDVTHSAFAYRGGDGVLKVLHAPLSGGTVEITRTTLPEYVGAIRRATGILVARPLRG
ncbi:MAG TPA: N-acetylmuramoyl-L-alanine amidase-like domain-containing protein [Gemmatimonadaceae bacterium]|nr:N-acetylmuramoyl-L-alanine amidase-like domain-containing protein [Gemmatimonadaceae bacterium]